MTERHDEVLRMVAEETFQTLAFMFPLEEAEDGAGAGDMVAAGVTFGGPIRGWLFLGVSEGMLPALGANMLGLGDGQESSPEQQRDAMKEMLNVICGNLLPLLAGAEAVFDVQAPKFRGPGGVPDAVEGMVLAGSARIALDAGLAELALFAKAPVPAPADLPAG